MTKPQLPIIKRYGRYTLVQYPYSIIVSVYMPSGDIRPVIGKLSDDTIQSIIISAGIKGG